MKGFMPKGIPYKTEQERVEAKRLRQKNRPKNKEYFKNYYINNKEKMLAQNKASHAKHREHRNNRSAAYREANYERDIFLRCRRSARIYNYPFNLELSDIIIPEVCPLLGVPLTRTQRQGRVWTNASIDRIIPELGYVKGNIMIMCDLANRMKMEATKEQLVTFATNVLKYYAPG